MQILPDLWGLLEDNLLLNADLYVSIYGMQILPDLWGLLDGRLDQLDTSTSHARPGLVVYASKPLSDAELASGFSSEERLVVDIKTISLTNQIWIYDSNS